MADLSAEQAERRDHVVWAVNERMHDDLRATGWDRVFTSIEQGWTIFTDDGRPTSRLPDMTKLAWASLLGHHEPATILNALRTWPGTDGGTYCPKPADIAHLLRARPSERSGPYHAPRDDNSEAALRLVADLVGRADEDVCECSPSPCNLVMNSSGVLFCPDCSGVEQGQVDRADELVNPSGEDDRFTPPLSSVVKLRKLRAARGGREIADRVAP